MAAVGPATRPAPPPAVTTVVVAPGHIHLLLRSESSTVPERKHSRDSKPDNVDDPKGKRRLEHHAGLVCVPRDAGSGDGETAARPRPGRVAVGEVCAVCVGDAAEVVDACDEGADKAEVDKGDEAGVCGGAVVGEEGEDGPGEGEDGDDEEDEDGGGGESVGVVVFFDEPGEHADGGDQSEDLPNTGDHENKREKHLEPISTASFFSYCSGWMNLIEEGWGLLTPFEAWG